MILLYLFTINLANVVILSLHTFLVVFFGITIINPHYFIGYAIATLLVFILLFLVKLYRVSTKRRTPEFLDLSNKKVVIGMTAYNDQDAIGPAVKDFLSHPRVSEVVVIDNNSADNTQKNAQEAGATVMIETTRGYGSVCIRALNEISKRGDILVLVEGDQTFKAKDLDKMMPYLENVDMVQGTRTTRELSSPDSQLKFLLNLGNQFVAKLMQLRFLGYRFTDVGCTYRVLRKDSFLKIQNRLKVKSSHFLSNLMVEALKQELSIIEIPITFWKRAGQSKGVGSKYFKGLYVAIRMCFLIYFS